MPEETNPTNEPAAPAPVQPSAGLNGDLEAQVVEALRTVYDPEIPVNIYDLGLIYEVRAFDDNTVFVRMTLTTPNCPAAGFIPTQVEQAVRAIPEVEDVRVKLTFDPPFTPDMMSDEARLALGLM